MYSPRHEFADQNGPATEFNIKNLQQLKNTSTAADSKITNWTDSEVQGLEGINNKWYTGNYEIELDKQEGKGDDAFVLPDEYWDHLFMTMATEETESETDLALANNELTRNTTYSYIELGKGVKAPVCPFFNRVSLSWYDYIKMPFGAIVLAPVRATSMFVTMLCAWSLAHLVTLGKSFEELQAEPITGIRQKIRWFVSNVVMRVFFFCSGFQWITKIGKQASSAEAPILVVAPHSSYYDSLPLILMGAPSVVARSETRYDFLVGQLVDMIQAVYVSRDNAQSRTSAIRAIQDRVDKIQNNPDKWNQIYIYPEGTCTNRCCLINFKIGAFIPGCNVQPVLIKYPNKPDNVSWTFDGPGFWKTLFLTLIQFTNYCELQYLPVYVPSEEEKRDPHLYAKNVQKAMAEALGVPVMDYVYEDGVALTKMNKHGLTQKLKAIWNARNKLKISGLTEIARMQELGNATAVFLSDQTQFTHDLLLHNSDSKIVTELFSQFRQPVVGKIDEREYIVYGCLLNLNSKVEMIIPAFFQMYTQGRKHISLEMFTHFLVNILLISEIEARNIYQTGVPQETMDLERFTNQVKKRLDFVKLLCLEISGHLTEYPPRIHEIEQCKRAAQQLSVTEFPGMEPIPSTSTGETGDGGTGSSEKSKSD